MEFEIGGNIVNSFWPWIFQNFSGLEPFEKGGDFSGSMEVTYDTCPGRYFQLTPM